MKQTVGVALRSLLKDFYNLTGIKTCLFDAQGNELCYYPQKHSSFCAYLRRDEEMNARCERCDREGFAACRALRAQLVIPPGSANIFLEGEMPTLS